MNAEELESYMRGMPEGLTNEHHYTSPEWVLWFRALEQARTSCPYSDFRSDLWALFCSILAYYQYRGNDLSALVMQAPIQRQIKWHIDRAEDYVKHATDIDAVHKR